MSELDQSVHCHTVLEIDRDGTSIKVVRLQSEARHWIVRQYCHVHVLRRGTTTGLSTSNQIMFISDSMVAYAVLT